MPYNRPTTEQSFKCIELCQSISDLKRDIVLFRYDSISGTIFILTSTETTIIIQRDGTWESEENEA